MTELRKVVTEHVPVERLPDDLRRGLENGQLVRVTVESGEDASVPRRTFRSFVGSAPGLYGSPKDAVEFIRGLRDESDR